MFNNCEHDPPDNNDILLCAGPKERQALAKVLEQHPQIYFAEDFILALHYAVQKQAARIKYINDEIGTEVLRAEDAEISFDRHLADICQEDVYKVFHHLETLFIDRYGQDTGVYRLDEVLHYNDRKEIYMEMIVPWLRWVRSAKRDKSTAEVSDKPDTEVSNKSTVESETNSPDDKSDNKDKKDEEENKKPNPTINKKPNTMDNTTFNQFKNEFESQSGNDSDNNIILYANNAERYALQKALMTQMSSNAANELITDMNMFLNDDSPEGDTRFYKLNRGEVEDVLEDIKYLVTESDGVLDTLEDFDEEQRKDLYDDVFEPWFQWLKEQKPKKANNKKITATTNNKTNTNTNNKTNITTNNTNMNDNTTDKTMNDTNVAENNMLGSIASIFSYMLGKLEPDMVRLSFDGSIAVKTASGYKTYNVAKKKAVNMDSLVMPDMSAFLLLPSTKVKVGDIIFRDGTFYSIISTDDTTNEIVGYNYESGKKETLVRETHCFLGNTYFYSKLVSPLLSFFGSKPKPDAKKEEGFEDSEPSEDTISMLLPLAMMSQNGDMNSILPLMLMSKMEDNEESSGMLKMLMLSGMMGNNAGMNNMLPLMLMSGNFPAI